MLIEYPQDGYNTFANILVLNSKMLAMYPTEHDKYDKLTPEQQEALATNATMWIRTCPSIKLPNPIENDVIDAQVVIMASSIDMSLSSYDPNAKAVTKEKVGDLEVDYDPRYKAGDDVMHPMAKRLLRPYGCSSGDGFSQSKVN